MEAVIAVVVKVIGALALAALTYLISKVIAYMHVTLDERQAAKLDYYAKQAALWVEEQAAAYLKSHAGAIPVPGSEKLQGAVAMVLDRVPGVTRDEAEQAVRAALPQLGMGASVLLGKLTEAVIQQTAISPTQAQGQAPGQAQVQVEGQ